MIGDWFEKCKNSSSYDSVCASRSLCIVDTDFDFRIVTAFVELCNTPVRECILLMY